MKASQPGFGDWVVLVSQPCRAEKKPLQLIFSPHFN